MPTTQQLVSVLQDDFYPDIGRARLLEYLNRAQKRLWNNDCAQAIWWNKADTVFPFPILTTTAGTLSYDVVGGASGNLVDSQGSKLTLQITDLNGVARSVNIRSVKQIFIMVTSLTPVVYDKKFYGERTTITGVNTYWSLQNTRAEFYKVPVIISDKTNLRNPNIQFMEDPGSFNNLYYVELYHTPVELSTESVPLTVDGDQWGDALLCGAHSFIEPWQNGKTDYQNQFEKFWIPKFCGQQNKHMDDRKPLRMTKRLCG
jgi:hypothetical protein